MRLLSNKTRFAIIAFSLDLMSFSYAQNDSISGIKLIDYYLIKKDINKADSVLKAQINYFKTNNKVDSLFPYPYYIGKLTMLKNDKAQAMKTIRVFVTEINTSTNSARTKYKSLINLADFYDEVSENQKSLDVTQEALKYALTAKNVTPEETGKVRYNIGASLLTVGDLENAKINFKAGLKDYESYKSTSAKALSDANNAVGATMWMSSKLDSAKYYYTKAIKAVEKAKGDSIENLYLATIIKSNVSLLEHSQGNLSQAITTQNSVIRNYEIVINTILDDNILSKAQRYQARAISNMSSFYNEYGDLKKANELVKFALQKKQLFLEPDDDDISTTKIQIGQSELSLQNYDLAIEWLNKGLDGFSKEATVNTYWKAAGLHALAEAYRAKKNIIKAKQYYEQSEVLFKESLGENYDKEFLLFLNNKALFLANNNDSKKAIESSMLAYNYVLKNNDEDELLLFNQINNLTEVYFVLGNYQLAKEWSKKGNSYLDEKIKASNSTLDSILIEYKRPSLLLLESKANYKLLGKKTPKALKEMIKKMDQAIVLLENRKTTLFNPEDINLLLTDFKVITDFSKKLNYELYELTKDKTFLNRTIELHESSIYNRIRSRLNMKNNIAFNDLPKSVIKREKKLKESLSSSLSSSNTISTFFEAETQWENFLDSIKQTYPKYYNMRYASFGEPLKNNLPENTTLVRYFFIEDDLQAFVADKNSNSIFKLNSEHLSENIRKLSENNFDIAATSKLLNQLYKQIWEPFENKITTEKIIIIPDRELFNLSFETLTPKVATSFKELTNESLLSNYSISYNYSLYLLNKDNKSVDYDEGFVAFAPGFNTEMKDDYKITVSDSITLDKTYLQLLPQPFTTDLAKEYSKFFSGKSYLNEEASKQVFTNNAKEHKIIHIGTHAESNNISPELSRLIFAKNTDRNNSTEDNSLYTFEIYNENLSSNLAILTACETGKPTYQAGEGMISLAHAFNYAGSESILTSLWKIDEQSSAKIIDLFYENLSEGLSKDKALQKAKQDYISTAEGRTAHPQYWAGLVLIGDASPIDISTNNNWWLWLIFVLLLSVILGVTYFKRHDKA